LALLIFGVIGFGFYTSQKDKAEQAYAAAIYEFEKSSFTSLQEGKLETNQYLDKFNLIKKDVSYFKGLFPLLIKTADFLIEKGNYEAVDTLLKDFKPHIDNATMIFLVNIRHAVVMENAGDIKGAIDLLEGIIKNGQKLMEHKVYFDLGRLYVLTGDKEKAKTNLQFAIDNTVDENLKKMAQVYLSEI